MFVHPQPGAARSLTVGASALDRFDISSRLGQGGNGIVYKAFDRVRGENVALKTFPHLHPDAIYGLKQEFRVLADVSHPNLVRLHGLFADEATWFFTMDLVEGVSFDAWVRPEGPLNEQRLRAALPQLVSAVTAIHAAGRLHRDLKPSNVLVSNAGHVVLLDFGLVIESSSPNQPTTENVVCGTPAYMAPEQAARQSISAASDAYSLGVILFEALTGALPFAGTSAEIQLAKQTQVAPSARLYNPTAPEDLAGLCAALLGQDIKQRPILASLTTHLGAPAECTPATATAHQEAESLVGRDAELAQLHAAYNATRSGTPVVMFVSGDSGMGKTALIEHFLSELRLQDHSALLAGRCYEQESLPFTGFDSLVDGLSRYLRSLPRAEAAALMPRDAAALSRMFPVLDRVEVFADAPRREIPEPQELRRTAFLAFAELLGRMRDRRPLVLCMDDTQWLDNDSLAFLRTLLIHGDPPPALTILSYRSEQNGLLQKIREAAHGNNLLDVRELHVGPLSLSEAEVLASRWIGTNLAEAPARSIAAEAGGTPFFVVELARFAARANRSNPEAQVSLASVLADHFAALSKESLRLLEVVALAGCPLPVEVALDAVKSSHADLDALRASRLLRASGGEELGAIECYHDRIREAVLSSLSDEARTGYYRRLAHVLTLNADSYPELLARCLEGAADFPLASVYAERAGDMASSATAFERAAGMYGKALSLGQLEPPARKALALKLAHTLAAAGRGPEAASAFLRCVADATGAEAIDLQRQAAEHLLNCGRSAEGEALLRRACMGVGYRFAGSVARAYLSLASTQIRLRIVNLRPQQKAMHQIRGPSASERLRLDCMRSATLGLANHAPMLSAAVADDWLLEALRADDSDHRARALSTQLYFHTLAFPTQDKRFRELSEAARLAVADDASPALRAFAAIGTAHAEVNRGRWTAARNGYAKTLELLRAECRGVAWEIDICLFYDQIAAFERGDFAEIARDCPTAIEEAYRRGRDWIGILLSSAHGTPARLVYDDVAGARSQLAIAKQRWVRSSTIQWADSLLALAEAYISMYCQDTDAGQASIEQVAPIALRSLLGRAAMPRVRVLSVRGGYALARLRARPSATDARHVVASCAAKLKREHLPHGKPHGELLEAGLAIADGRLDRAAPLMQQAIERFDQLDMRLYAAATRRRLGQLQGGDAGIELRAAGDAVLRESAKNVEAMTEMLCPGCQVR